MMRLKTCRWGEGVCAAVARGRGCWGTKALPNGSRNTEFNLTCGIRSSSSRWALQSLQSQLGVRG